MGCTAIAQKYFSGSIIFSESWLQEPNFVVQIGPSLFFGNRFKFRKTLGEGDFAVNRVYEQPATTIAQK